MIFDRLSPKVQSAHSYTMATILIFLSTSHIRTLDWKACTHFHWTDRVLITPEDLAIRHSDNPAAFVSNNPPDLAWTEASVGSASSKAFHSRLHQRALVGEGRTSFKKDAEERRKYVFHDTGVPTEDRGSDACHEVLIKHQLLIRKSECSHSALY